MQPLRWLSVDLLTGGILCDLPGLSTTAPFRRTLGVYETQTVNLVVTDKIDPSWLRGTLPGASALIAYRGLPGQEVIYWGGVVLQRTRQHASNVVQMTLATPECYLDRRYTGAYAVTGRDQNLIVADLVSQFVITHAGLPVTVTTVGSAGTVRDRTYNDYDDKTVYSVLGDLMGVISGPEWTGHWTWDRVANTITPVLFVGNRLGTAATPGLAPAVTFDSAALLAGTLVEDFTTGNGANVVTATSSGQGSARPQATSPNPLPSSFAPRPMYEYRYSPSTSITDVATLQGHSDAVLALLQNGTNTVTLKATATAGPMLGVDWNLGDDIGYEFLGPAFPSGFAGTARCIGYEADDLYTSPVLYVPAIH